MQPPSSSSNSEAEPAPRPTRKAKRSTKNATHRWSRLIHVYTSMACFVVVLFFSVTGLTLNHPTWTFGGKGSSAQTEGVLPADFKAGEQVDWLRVAEYLRKEHSLRGEVTARSDSAGEGSISFRGPGYSADAFFDIETGAYQIGAKSAGPLGVANDLHKGRDTASSFNWLIDGSAIFLIVISLTGLTMQFFLRKRRRSALWSVGGGAVVFAVLVFLTL